MNKMKILTFGTGVIGSLYGALLAEEGQAFTPEERD